MMSPAFPDHSNQQCSFWQQILCMYASELIDSFQRCRRVFLHIVKQWHQTLETRRSNGREEGTVQRWQQSWWNWTPYQTKIIKKISSDSFLPTFSSFITDCTMVLSEDVKTPTRLGWDEPGMIMMSQITLVVLDMTSVGGVFPSQWTLEVV